MHKTDVRAETHSLSTIHNSMTSLTYTFAVDGGAGKKWEVSTKGWEMWLHIPFKCMKLWAMTGSQFL